MGRWVAAHGARVAAAYENGKALPSLSGLLAGVRRWDSVSATDVNVCVRKTLQGAMMFFLP